MPLPPLPEPKSRKQRAQGLALGLPASSLLISSLIAINGAQTLSLLISPFSRSTFRNFNRWAANTWWGWCVSTSRLLYSVDIKVTGDPVPKKENAVVVVNHQQMSDINFLMFYALSKERLGDLKWFVKDPIKYIPGVGWGMLFLDCPFVKRDWTADKASIERTFQRLLGDEVPLWLITFAEGTRLSTEKLERSREYARSRGLPEPRHVQVPRTKGFTASVQGLRQHLDSVYDITIGYEKGVPSLWQYIRGLARTAHLHVRRYPIETLPESREALSQWLLSRYQEKDELLEHYYRHGAFPDNPD